MAVDPETRLRRLIERTQPPLRRAFEDIIDQLQGDNSLNQIAQFIEEGRIQDALEQAARAGARFAAQVNGVYVLAGTDASELISQQLQIIVDFDQTNFRATQTMQETRLRLIQAFSSEQEIATREALTEGVRRGLNPRQQAQAFRSSIGLTFSQVKAVNNYRRLLELGSREALQRQLRDRRFDATVNRAIDAGRPLSQTQINRMVDRYRERFIKFRSEVIARTESLRAVHLGTEEMFSQALDQGLIDPNELTRTWHTAGDSRVRDSHASMNGQRRPVGQPFISGNGNRLRHPGDINAPASETVQCRCSLSTRFTAPLFA